MLRRSSRLLLDGTWSPWGASSRLNPSKYSGKTKKSPTASSAAASTGRTASASAINSSPLFPPTSAPIHLYANKENAWKDYTDDRFYGAKRFKEYWMNMFKDRGMKYYFFGILILTVFGGTKLWRLQEMQQRTEGLVGPRKKNYRSRLTVVLDVDETIVSYGDKAFRMKAGLVARPYLAELLDYLTSIDAEVILWAACSDRYMRQVLSVVDPSGIRVSAYVVRDNIWFSNDNYYEKNIAWLKRPPENTLIIENRALAVRNCNANAILVDDFIRGEYMESGQDRPLNDQALHTIKNIVQDLEESGMSVPEYLADEKRRNSDIHEIPCHLAIRQLPDELARGIFYFVGNKYIPSDRKRSAEPAPNENANAKKSWWHFW